MNISGALTLSAPASNAKPSLPGRFPLLGHALPLLRRPLEFNEALRDRGDVVRFWLGRRPACMISNPGWSERC